MNVQFLLKDPKTTITALVGGITTLLGVFGIVNLPAEAQGAIITITIILIGLFAKDGSTGFSKAEKTDVIARLKHEGSTQYDPSAEQRAAEKSADAKKPCVVAGVILLVASLLMFPLIQSCTTMGANQASLQDQWNTLTPDQKAHTVLNGVQKELDTQFDTIKLYVDLNPQYRPVWTEQILPKFDEANKAVRVMMQTAQLGTLTPDAVYAKIQPIINDIALKMIMIGLSKPKAALELLEELKEG